MDTEAFTLTHFMLSGDQTSANLVVAHLTPYAIIVANYFIFNLLRQLVATIIKDQPNPAASKNRTQLLRLMIEELISTCELCADCAELNVVYEKHGSILYGLCLALLSYLWMSSFGDAHTTPGYLAEDYFLEKGNSLLKTGETYARFIGQSLAVPIAWRFASLYWKLQLIREHGSYLVVENCRSSLTTTTLNGVAIEFSCCLMCRLVELVGHELSERHDSRKRIISLSCSFICSLLVVLALDLSGGYFHPMLAASLEYGCKGANFYQHALVFWFGPLVGHIVARAIFTRTLKHLLRPAKSPVASLKIRSTTRKHTSDDSKAQQVHRTSPQETHSRRLTRSNSQRKLKGDKID